MPVFGRALLDWVPVCVAAWMDGDGLCGEAAQGICLPTASCSLSTQPDPLRCAASPALGAHTVTPHIGQERCCCRAGMQAVE